MPCEGYDTDEVFVDMDGVCDGKVRGWWEMTVHDDGADDACGFLRREMPCTWVEQG